MTQIPPYRLDAPSPSQQKPLLVSSPHSGDQYPPELLKASRLDAHEIRRSEDMYVADLVRAAPTLGATRIAATYPRAYIDVNRAPDEIDPRLFDDTRPTRPDAPSPRALAGLGVIPRLVGENTPIYDTRLPYAEAEARIKRAYQPFHTALQTQLTALHAQFGKVLLLDMHSMPTQTPLLDAQPPAPDIILGDRHGKSCAPEITSAIEAHFIARGYRVARNKPYAGGHITQHYADPANGIHALQIEIARALYMDETTYQKHDGYDRLQADLTDLFATLADSPRVNYSNAAE